MPQKKFANRQKAIGIYRKHRQFEHSKKTRIQSINHYKASSVTSP